MNNSQERLVLSYHVTNDDFSRAGEASSDVKAKLKLLGVAPDIIRRIAISMYEGEINMVIHAGGGDITVFIGEENVVIELKDQGPGIEDVEKAMQAGFSTADDEIRNLGFGAGMGLPNMKKYSDELIIDTKKNIGTTVTVTIDL